MTTLVFDVETNGFLEELDTMWCIGIADITDGVVKVYTDHSDKYDGTIAEGLARLSAAERIVAHNGLGFDHFAIEKLYPGTLKRAQMYDTIVAGALVEPDQRSHAIAAYGQRWDFPKGDFKEFDRFSDEMVTYMVRDVDINVKVYHYVTDLVAKQKCERALDIEHKVQWCLVLQQQHGFRLDVEAAQELDAELRGELFDLEHRLCEVFGETYRPKKGKWDWQNYQWDQVDTITPKANNRRYNYTQGAAFTPIIAEMFNPGSRPQVARRLMQLYRGWRPTQWTASGQPQIDEKSLNGLDYAEARLVCRYLTVAKMLGQLSDGKNGWLKVVKPTGYVHGRVKSVGCRTHRMSHFSPNLAQVSKKDKRMRQVWVANEGEVMVGCDASGLELRMLAHYLGKYDGGAYGEAVAYGSSSDGTDAHTRMMKAVGFKSRDVTKTLTYAFLYGAGNGKLGEVANKDRELAGERKLAKSGESRLGGEVRKKAERGIEGLEALIQLAQRADKQRGFIRSLDGRIVQTNGQHSALNTLLQSAGAVIMKAALAIFHFDLCKAEGLVNDDDMPVGWSYLANVHDEAQFSAKPEIAERLGQLFAQSIVEAGKQLDMRCELAGEYMIGNNWSETH